MPNKLKDDSLVTIGGFIKQLIVFFRFLAALVTGKPRKPKLKMASRYIYVDHSNVVFSRQKESGEQFRINFAAFAQFLECQKSFVKRKIVFGSYGIDQTIYWPQKAKDVGFEVKLYERSYENREKCVDTQFTVSALRDCFEKSAPGDEFVLVTGDLDYLPLVETLQEKGRYVTLVFWKTHTAKKLRSRVNQFIALEQFAERIEGRRAA